MAYNPKYVLKYCNVNGKSLRIEILEDGYIGQAFLIVNQDKKVTNHDDKYIMVNIDGEYQEGRDENLIEGTSNPFSLQYSLDKEGKQVSIMTTVANMSFWADELFNIDELLTSDETALKTRFFLDDALVWEGFVVPDFFSEEIAEYRQVNLTSSDRIGILKDVKYPIDSTNDQIKSFFDILNKCLKLTGLDLGFDILADFTCDEWEVQNNLSAFHRTYVSELRFNKSETEVLKCYEVIQSIMNQFNCFIVQNAGKWCIYNKDQLEKGNGTVLSFNSDGSFVSSSSFDQKELWFSKVDTGGMRTIIPVGSENTIKLDLGNNVLYPKNYSFTPNGLFLPYWTKSLAYDIDITNEIPAEYDGNGNVIDTYLDSLYRLRINSTRKRVDYWDGEADVKGIDYRWPRLESDPFKVSTNDGKRMSFDLTIKAIGKPNTFVAVMVLMEFSDLPNELFSLSNDGYFYNVSYLKLNQPDLQNVDKLVLLKMENKYNNPLLATDQELKLTVNAARGTKQGNLDLNNATFKVRVYPILHDTNPDTLVYPTILKEVKIDFKMPNEVPKYTRYETTVDGNYTKKYDATTVLFGDYQTQGQNGYFYQYRDDSRSITYTSNGVRTKNWSTINDPQKESLLKHSIRQKTQSIGRATNELKIGFELENINPLAIYRVRCQSEKYILVNPESDYLTNQEKFITANTGKYLNKERYLFAGGSIDFMRCEAEMTLIQTQDREFESKEYIYSEF